MWKLGSSFLSRLPAPPLHSLLSLSSLATIMHDPPLHPGLSASPSQLPSPVNPADYSILREGQAEILMHGNDVFYNKAQVVNRDLSVAVLRAFVTKRQEEHLEKEQKKNLSQNTDAHHCGKSTSEAKEENCLSRIEFKDPKEPPAKDDARIERRLQDHECSGSDKSKTATMKPLRVLEALAASGLRAIRYAREVEGIDSVVALDNDKVAVEACKRNVKLNGKLSISKVHVELGDARTYMLNHEKQFDVVDIDPYGSPSIFLDSAVQSIADGGLLMCTATDMAVLCGNYGEVCYTKYGSYPVRAKYCHEMAVRILLSSIESHANRYKRHIVPLLSISVDFYVRVFVRIFTSASAIKATPSKLSYVYQCVGCDSFYFQPVGRISQKNNTAHYMPGTGPCISPDCKQCGKHFEMGGPIWSDPIHHPEWVSSIYTGVAASKSRYTAFDKVHSLLTAVSEELLDVPLFISLHSVSATLKCVSPSTKLFCAAILNAGYRTSCSHASPLALKTDAPMDVIWDIMRCWVRLHPVKTQPTGTPAFVILSKDPVLEANFSKGSLSSSKAQKKGMARFLPNPEEFWGPKARAGRQKKSVKHALDDRRDQEESEEAAKRQKREA